MMANKGPPYEREVCKQLSLWWSGGEDDFIFWRSSGSGATATSRHRRGKTATKHTNDVCAVDPVGETLMKLVSIEIKRGRFATGNGRGRVPATVHDLMDMADANRPGVYENFFSQAQAGADQAGVPYWLVIHRRDHRESVVWMPLGLHVRLGSKAGAKRLLEVHPYIELHYRQPWHGDMDPTEVGRVMRPVCGTTLEMFIWAVTPDHVRTLVEMESRRKSHVAVRG